MTEAQFRRPAFAAVAVVFLDGRVLAVTRRGSTTDWSLPGGKRDPEESLLECAVRELAEETGIAADKASMRAVFNSYDAHHNEVTAFLVERWSGNASPQEIDVGVMWAAPSLLLDPACTFHEFNRRLFAILRIYMNIAYLFG